MKKLIAIVAFAALLTGCESTPGSNDVLISGDALSASPVKSDTGRLACRIVTVHSTDYIDIEDAEDCRVTGI
ncbi:hypothetical protein EKG38_03405 [Shewanella canadensis]|uniref:Uncharacterized protein n=1 Tax=Shewanella canadensis TaxID=271096 RepID=A0A431WZW4_9GAMM|nr:hypothetical protein [Shewanella canadensis]RTR40969.1 hypothetical protein EKG38_03405 [Shewanella canadensis]